MKVFVIGAAGYIGSVIAAQLRAAGMLAMSADISNERAQQLLGWQPREVGLVEDLTTGSYRTT